MVTVNRTLLVGAVLSVGALVGVSVFVACSSSTAAIASCNTDPWQCQAGTTCWPKECGCPAGQACDTTNCVPVFGCVPSVPGKMAADNCVDTFGPSATCGDNQACIEIDAGSGLCSVYCDLAQPTKGCPTDQTCTAYHVGAPSNPTIQVCVPKPGMKGPLELDSSVGGGGGDDAGNEIPDAFVDASTTTLMP